MATGKKVVSKNVNEFNVVLFDNGFSFTYSGNDVDGNWADAKLIVSDVDKLCELIRGVIQLPRE